jgi:CRISPR-associated protein Cmr2
LKHLLALHLGGVQDSITQAKRTRDLWSGSQLFCELAGEAAHRLVQAEGPDCLIFPPPAALGGAEGDVAAGISNKVLALVQGDPRALARQAREAMHERLREIWNETKVKRDALIDRAAWGVASEQLETALDFHAAWAPLDGEEGYAVVRARVEEALVARRRLHTFTQWKRQRDGVHKSSLDGARESVLQRPENNPRTAEPWSQYRIGRREELDALGLIKRTRKQPGHFVPIPTIGLATWLAQARDEDLEPVRKLCRELDFIESPPTRAPEWVRKFPFDAQIMLADRWRPYLQEHDKGEADERRLAAVVRPLHEAIGQPFPYVACLMADGDRMGALIRHLAQAGGREAHRRLSEALAAFARGARELVESHRGVLVYAGGDDVLAFVCPSHALACARALRDSFAEHLAGFSDSDGRPPTLSLGLGIGHVLDSLGDLLELGRQAEALAKRERDQLLPVGLGGCLAVLVARRSGRHLSTTSSWEDRGIDEAVGQLWSKRLPLGKVREVDGLLRRLPRVESVAPSEEKGWLGLLGGEVSRILARAEPGGGGSALTAEALGLIPNDGEEYAELFKRIEGWVARVEIAAVLAQAGLVQDGGTR